MFHRVLLCFVLSSYLLFHLAVLQILIFPSKWNLRKVAYTSCRQAHCFGRKSRKCPGNSSAALSALTTANICKPKRQQMTPHLENALTSAPKTSELGMGQAASWKLVNPSYSLYGSMLRVEPFCLSEQLHRVHVSPSGSPK